MLLIDEGNGVVIRAPRAQHSTTQDPYAFQTAIDGQRGKQGNTNDPGHTGPGASQEAPETSLPFPYYAHYVPVSADDESSPPPPFGVTGMDGNGPETWQTAGTDGTAPVPPAITVDNDVTAGLKPALGQAEMQASAARGNLIWNTAKANGTQQELDDLYADMERHGSTADKLERARELEERLASERAQVRADQRAVDSANAKVAALKTALYAEQLKADQRTAATSKGKADLAFQDLRRQLPASLALKQGETLTDQEIARLTPEQRGAYFRYLQAQTIAVNDQNKVNATTVELNRNYAQWQAYASDPGRYGSIAQDALNFVNARLRPLNLEMRGPARIAPKLADQNLADINQVAPYYFSAWQTSSALVAATGDVLQAHIVLADAQASYARWRGQNPYLMAPGSPHELAIGKAQQDLVAAQQRAEPAMLQYTVKAAFTGKLEAQLGVQQAERKQGEAQARYDQWRAANPGVSAAGTSDERALFEANGSLALARQRLQVADLTFKAAQAQQQASGLELHARQIWVAENGDAICMGDGSRGGSPVFNLARDNAKAARENADRLSLQANKLQLQYRIAETQNQIAAARTQLDSAGPDDTGADFVLVSYSTSTSSNTGMSKRAQAQANLTAAQDKLQFLQFQEQQGQYVIDQYEFLAGLPEHLKRPQTENDRKELQEKQAEFSEKHFKFVRENQFKYGPINGADALAQVRADLSNQQKKLDNRGWMHSATDWINESLGGDRSELETFLQDRLTRLEKLEGRRKEMSPEDYQTELQSIMDGYGADYVRMSLGEGKTDGRWQTANEISRFAAATLVGIAATVAGGGVNVVAGAAAAFAVYEAWDVADDAAVALDGGDIASDGHVSLVGFGGLTVDAMQGQITWDQLGDTAIVAGKDIVMDTVSSLAVAGGTGLTVKTSSLVAGKALPVIGVDGTSLTGRVLATGAGRTAGQVVMGGGQVTNSGVDLAFEGDLFTADGGRVLTRELKNQGVYLAAAPFVGAGSGALSKRVVVQGGFDLATNYGQEIIRAGTVDGRFINWHEGFAALVGTVPGTAMNLVARNAATRGAVDGHPPAGTVQQPGTAVNVAHALPTRYVANVNPDGSRSFGLVDADGRLTADVNAPWSGQHPSEIVLLETSTLADGTISTNAVHFLFRNADGTYNGVRVDADGTTTPYLTGGPNAGHPLVGIRFFNAAGTGPQHGQPGHPGGPERTAWSNPQAETGNTAPSGGRPPVPPARGNALRGGMGDDDGPALSAYDSLIGLMGRIYAARHAQEAAGTDSPIRQAISQHNERTSDLTLSESDWSYLAQIHQLAYGRPDGARMSGEGTLRLPQGGVDPLRRAIDEGIESSPSPLDASAPWSPMARYTPQQAQNDTFSFTRAGVPDDASSTHTIYINANLAHIHAVAEFAVRGIVDNPEAFPGVVRVRIGGPDVVRRQTNTIAIEVEGAANLPAVIAALQAYGRQHPSRLNAEVPEMTQPVGKGMSMVENPTPPMVGIDLFARMDYGFVEITTDPAASVRTTALRLAWRDSMEAQRTEGGDLLTHFTANVRKRFREFGIDPDQPWRNLRDDGSFGPYPEDAGPPDPDLRLPYGQDGASQPVSTDFPGIALPPLQGGGPPTPGAMPQNRIPADSRSRWDATNPFSAPSGSSKAIVLVRDPDTGEIIQAELPGRFVPAFGRAADSNNVLDSSHVLLPGQSLTGPGRAAGPQWRLYRNSEGVPQLLPVVAGSSRPHNLPSSAASVASFLDRIARLPEVDPGYIRDQMVARNAPRLLTPAYDPAGNDLAPTGYLRQIYQMAREHPRLKFVSESGSRPEAGEPQQPFAIERGLEAIFDGSPLPSYQPGRAYNDAFQFVRLDVDPYNAGQKIFVNANPNHVGELLQFMVRDIMDGSEAFPGVHSLRVVGPRRAEGQIDTLVFRVDTPANRQRVVDAIAAYQLRHPEYFMRDVPAMTEPVADGIALGADPTMAMTVQADVALAELRLPPARNGDFLDLRATATLLALRDTDARLPATAANSAARQSVLAAMTNVYLRRFGVDPDLPSQNLPYPGASSNLVRGTSRGEAAASDANMILRSMALDEVAPKPVKRVIEVDSPSRIRASQPELLEGEWHWHLFDEQSEAIFCRVHTDVDKNTPFITVRAKDADLPNGVRVELRPRGFSFVIESLKLSQRVWEGHFGRPLMQYDQSLAWDNRARFQLLYSMVRQENVADVRNGTAEPLTPQEIGDIAIRRMGGGLAQKLGFGDLSVTMVEFEAVQLQVGPKKGTWLADVPTGVVVHARRTSPVDFQA
jgi:hypothetical protein